MSIFFPRPLGGEVRRCELKSEVLQGNALQDPLLREVFVYTPPGYDEKQQYPVVFILPGFGSTPRALLNFDPLKPNIVELFDALISNGECAPAILVLPDATNAWGGSQFVDSPVASYQRFLVDEVVAFVDAHFSTLAQAQSRAVVGRSSGGFGALRIALDRPGVFSVVGSHAGDAAFEVSLKPMLLRAAVCYHAEGGLEAFARRMQEEGPKSGADHEALFVLAAATAYSSDPALPWPYVAMPFDSEHGGLNTEVWSQWLKHDPVLRIKEVPDSVLQSLSYTFIDAGNADECGLQFAARQLHNVLETRGVHVVYEEFAGGHRGTSWRYKHSLPLLIAALKH